MILLHEFKHESDGVLITDLLCGTEDAIDRMLKHYNDVSFTLKTLWLVSDLDLSKIDVTKYNKIRVIN